MEGRRSGLLGIAICVTQGCECDTRLTVLGERKYAHWNAIQTRDN